MISQAQRDRKNALRRRALWAGFCVVGAVRLWLCAQAPVETSDLDRNASYAEAFWRHGFHVYDLFPRDLHSPHFHCLQWPRHTYDYPVTALLFFAVATRFLHTLTALKVLLTACELTSAFLIGRITGARWLGLAYFASPLSLWWISMEGQTEALMALLCLCSLYALQRQRQVLAHVFLGAAIQTKGLPLLLLPSLLIKRASLGQRARNWVVLALTFIPSWLALREGSYVKRMFSEGYKPSGTNSVYWIPWQHRNWMSDALLTAEAIYSYGLLFIALCGAGYALWHALRRTPGRERGRALWRNLVHYVPLLLLIAWFKNGEWTQFWYFVMVPAFACSLRDRRTRYALILVTLFEPRACSQLWDFLQSVQHS